MKRIFVLSIVSIFSFNLYACPELTGKYATCKSEVNPKMRGEYNIEQHQENDYQIYKVQFIDDETGEQRVDQMATNGVKVSRKERVPKVGITVKVEASSKCVGEAVVTSSAAYKLGIHVGSFTTKIYKTGTTLHSDIDGSYLGKDINKRITCELK